MGFTMLETDHEAFEKNFSEAKGYHYRAEQFVRDGQRPSLIFNIASVALERYLVALCAHYGAMPMNHNFTCLVDAAESVAVFSPELKEKILSLDKIFGICSIDDYHHGTPTPSDSVNALSMCNGILEMFKHLDIEPTKTDLL